MQNMGTCHIDVSELEEVTKRIILAAKGRKKHAAFCAVFEGIRDMHNRGFEDGVQFAKDKIIDSVNRINADPKSPPQK